MDIGRIVRIFEAIPVFDPFRRAPEPTPPVREEPVAVPEPVER